VTVAPVTHTPPHDPTVAIEIPSKVERHLGLDGERSWIILGVAKKNKNSSRFPGDDDVGAAQTLTRCLCGLRKLEEAGLRGASAIPTRRQGRHSSRLQSAPGP
jgi:hypothetical protein